MQTLKLYQSNANPKSLKKQTTQQAKLKMLPQQQHPKLPTNPKY
jgi:hypothetical protein